VKFFITLFLMFIIHNSCFSATKKQKITIESTPQGAIISVRNKKEPVYLLKQTIAGISPVTKVFKFKRKRNLWITLEKRGYLPFTKEISPKDTHITINLKKAISENPISDFSFPVIKSIVLITPKLKIIERGFKTEEVSKEKTEIAKKAICDNIINLFSSKYNIVLSNSKPELRKKAKSVFRNSRDGMSEIDPIRLKYLTKPQFLKTRSSIKACQLLGKKFNAQAILVVSGKENIETKGMKIGKVGLTVGGTLSSYTASYNQALSNGDSFFIYTVYTPEFAEGTLLKAALIDCNTGEFIWVNRGKWGKVDFNNNDIAKKITNDLFADLIQK